MSLQCVQLVLVSAGVAQSYVAWWADLEWSFPKTTPSHDYSQERTQTKLMMSQLQWLRPETRERGWAPPSGPVSSVPFCSTLITQGFFFKILFKFLSIFIQNSSDMFIATLFTKTTRRSNPRVQQQVHEQTKCSFKDPGVGTSLAVQWLRLCLPMPGVRVQSLVGELRRHMPCTQNTKAGNRSNIVTHLIKFAKFNKDCKNSPHEKNL